MVGAERADQVGVAAAAHAGHLRPERLRELHGEAADAARGADDQDPLPLIESRPRPTPTVLRYMDSMIGIFQAGGFSIDLTHHAMHAMGSRLLGFSQELFDDTGFEFALDLMLDGLERLRT